MGLAKCVQCKKYIDDGEAVPIAIDDNHDAIYCVTCAPDESDRIYSSEEDEDY